MDQLHYATITEIAKGIRAGELSPVAVTEAQLARIEALDGRLAGYATVLAEQALAEARAAETALAGGHDLGPLHGIPIAVKDLCYTRGTRTMGATRVTADFVPDFDATVVQRLRAAGAVLLGKLNLTEGAMGGYHPDFEIPVNPWAAERWTGVSSSGSGVATAAGLCYASLGSDTGGSIRFPSACCGVVGIKPTWGRVSRYGVLPLAESLDHVGPMARSVTDAALILQVIAGHDVADPSSRHEPVPDLLASFDRGVTGVRIGYDERYVEQGIDPEVVAGVRAGLDVLSRQGAEIVAVSMPDVTPHLAAWSLLCAAEAVLAHERHYPVRADDYGPWFRQFLDLGATVSGADYARANNLRRELESQIRATLSTVDVMACPSMPVPAPAIRREELYGGMEASTLDTGGANLLQFTAPFDFTGNPTISLPCGFSQGGLPLSLQLVGHHLQEDLLCRTAFAFESATDWHRAHPAV